MDIEVETLEYGTIVVYTWRYATRNRQVYTHNN